MKENNLRFPALLAGFFLSGAAALVYETLWVRAFSLVMGGTAVAVSAVLSAYMAGLALGSWHGGKLADRLPREKLPALFIILELLTALAACATMPAIAAAKPSLYAAGLLNAPRLLQSAFWFSVSAAIMIIPTTMMGATLPVLARWRAVSKSGAADSELGLLYGANTFGAIFGAFAAGFFLIKSAGVTASFFIAAVFNACAAAAAFAASRLPAAPVEPDITEEAPAPAGFTPLAAVLFLTGSAAMICEVAWTRAFALVLGSSTYAFTIMLLCVLLGLAAGSAAFGAYRKTNVPGPGGLVFVSGLLAAVLLAYLPAFNVLPYFFVKFARFASSGSLQLHLLQFFLCSVVMLIPSLLMGVIYPWAVAAARPDRDRIGSSAGSLYSAMTAGNIAGSALTGLALLPRIGAEKSLVTAAVLYALASLAAALFVWKADAPRKAAAAAALATLVLSGVFLRPRWDPYVLTSGAFLYAPEYSGRLSYADFRKHLHYNNMLYFKEGVSSTVAVFQTSWKERFLRVNGKTDASTASDMPAQFLLAYLPYLLHTGRPASALVIGLGSGVTAGALAAAPERMQVDCAEIEPAMTNAVRFFSAFNHILPERDNFRVYAEDGRRFLSVPGRKYDVISSEPSNPWIAGVANLYTKEAFTLARGRLNAGGVFCQWFHTYSMDENDFKLVMNTFASVFPNVILMSATNSDLMLMGSVEPWDIDYSRIVSEFKDNTLLQRDMYSIGLSHPFALLADTFVLNDAEFRKYCAGAGIHTDDKPMLEYTAPHFLFTNRIGEIFSHVLDCKSSFLPDGLRGFSPTDKEYADLYNFSGEALMRSKYLDQAEKMFDKARAFNPRDPRTLTNLGRVYNLRFDHLRSEQILKKAISIDPGYALAYFHLGMLYLDQGFEDKGLENIEKGLRLSPDDPMGCLQAARIYLSRGRCAEAKALLERGLRSPAASPELRMNLTYLLSTI